jgi:hypothetical protein
VLAVLFVADEDALRLVPAGFSLSKISQYVENMFKYVRTISLSTDDVYQHCLSNDQSRPVRPGVYRAETDVALP